MFEEGGTKRFLYFPTMRPTLLETEAQDRKENVTRTFPFFFFLLFSPSAGKLGDSGCRGFCSVTGQEALVYSTTILPRIFPRRKKREKKKKLLFTQKRSRGTNKQSTQTKQNKTERKEKQKRWGQVRCLSSCRLPCSHNLALFPRPFTLQRPFTQRPVQRWL